MSLQAPSFYWYDYETFGTNPALDRPAQFAGLRTDINLNPIGEPLLIYNRLTDDYLPDPDACRITGISPATVSKEGVCEREFIARIVAELSHKNTCNVGYNSIRFDDEFSRFTLFRNFHDPYEHEWKNGNSRWDLLDIVRLTRALRPADLQWPFHQDGKPSNRLEDLTRANGLSHENAHDALSDVLATIAVAKLIKTKKPELFEFAFANRSKSRVLQMLNPRQAKPVLHVSGMYPGAQGHIALVAAIAKHPVNANGIVVCDLRQDPQELAALASKGEAGIDEIAKRLFTRTEDLAPGRTRLPLKTVHANRSPVLVPVSTLDDASAERLGIDKQQALKHFKILQSLPDMQEAIGAAMQNRHFDPPEDSDAKLYSGGFFSQADRDRFTEIRTASPDRLSELAGLFEDDRADEMLFRYRARNFPDSLSDHEQQDWQDHCKRMLYDEQHGIARDMHGYLQRIGECDWSAEQLELKESLLNHAAELQRRYPAD